MITNPQLPPIKGYVEVEINGKRAYKNITTGELYGQELNYSKDIWSEIAAAIREGVNEV